MTWEGRRLISTTKNGALVQYKYDDGGLRVSKQDSSGITRYTYDNGKIVHQYTENNNVITNELFFRYDENGAPLSVNYNGTEYFYVLNLQGDIIGIINNTGALVVEYTYDSWGKLISTTGSMATTLGTVNPLRYRGYYYDTDTGFYYCTSRYYDPEIGRFINADGYVSTGQGVLSYNMFAYCLNNPVNYCDTNGESALLAAICGVASPVLGVIALGLIAVAVLTDAILKNPPAFPTLTFPEIKTNSKTKTETKDKSIPAPRLNEGTTYYHVTTPENAAKIISTQMMFGSNWEGGYVYAWRIKPSKYAAENSGAHMGVIISFKTNAQFIMDTGINDWRVKMYSPVVSVLPGPIVVWDVEIVGVV